MAHDEDGGFFPRGAIAFFLIMAAFYAVFWFAMYALLAGRA
jgi:hypothetical protein